MQGGQVINNHLFPAWLIFVILNIIIFMIFLLLLLLFFSPSSSSSTSPNYYCSSCCSSCGYSSLSSYSPLLSLLIAFLFWCFITCLFWNETWKLQVQQKQTPRKQKLDKWILKTKQDKKPKKTERIDDRSFSNLIFEVVLLMKQKQTNQL